MDSTKKNSTYIVASRGTSLPDVDLAKLKRRLCAAYDMNEEAISERLLNGKVRKIKSFDNFDEADKLKTRLSRWGLSCHVYHNDLSQAFSNDEFSNNSTVLSIAIGENVEISSTSQTDDVPVLSKLALDQSDNAKMQQRVNAQSKPKSFLRWWLTGLILLVIVYAMIYAASLWLVG